MDATPARPDPGITFRCAIAAPGPVRRWLAPVVGGLLLLATADPVTALAAAAVVLLPLRISRLPSER